jgi:hypothetical protein
MHIISAKHDINANQSYRNYDIYISITNAYRLDDRNTYITLYITELTIHHK